MTGTASRSVAAATSSSSGRGRRCFAASTATPSGTRRPTGAASRGCTSQATVPSATTRATSGSSGRVDDVMNVSGHRISTIEVESALVDHQSVAEAAVVGKNDPITGQAIFAFVILRGTARAERGPRGRAARARRQGHRADREAQVPDVHPGPAQDPLGQDHAPPAARHRRRARSLGDTTTLADPNVVETIRAESWKAED